MTCETPDTEASAPRAPTPSDLAARHPERTYTQAELDRTIKARLRQAVADRSGTTLEEQREHTDRVAEAQAGARNFVRAMFGMDPYQ